MLSAHTAVFFMGIAGVLGGASGFEPWRSTSYRVTFGGLLLAIWVLLRYRKQLPGYRRSAACLGLGVMLAIHWFAFFQSIDYLGVMLGSAMIGLEPLIVALCAAIFLRETLPVRYRWSLAISLLGFGALAIQAGFGQPDLWKGCAWAVFSYVVFALFVLANRVWVQQQSAVVISALEMVGAIPLTLIMTPGPWFPQTAESWGYALALGFLCTGLAYALYNNSMRVISASIAGIFLSLEVVYGMLGGWVIGDRMALLTAAAIVLISNLIVIDVVYFSIKRRRQKTNLFTEQT